MEGLFWEMSDFSAKFLPFWRHLSRECRVSMDFVLSAINFSLPGWANHEPCYPYETLCSAPRGGAYLIGLADAQPPTPAGAWSNR